MQVTLPNGLVLNGTSDQVTQAAKALGFSIGEDGIYYNSSTRGLIRIADMDDTHLQNALRKRYRQWASDLSGLTGTKLIDALRNGPSDATTKAMAVQLAIRVANRRIV